MPNLVQNEIPQRGTSHLQATSARVSFLYLNPLIQPPFEQYNSNSQNNNPPHPLHYSITMAEHRENRENTSPWPSPVRNSKFLSKPSQAAKVRHLSYCNNISMLTLLRRKQTRRSLLFLTL